MDIKSARRHQAAARRVFVDRLFRQVVTLLLTVRSAFSMSILELHALERSAIRFFGMRPRRTRRD